MAALFYYAKHNMDWTKNYSVGSILDSAESDEVKSVLQRVDESLKSIESLCFYKTPYSS